MRSIEKLNLSKWSMALVLMSVFATLDTEYKSVRCKSWYYRMDLVVFTISFTRLHTIFPGRNFIQSIPTEIRLMTSLVDLSLGESRCANDWRVDLECAHRIFHTNWFQDTMKLRPSRVRLDWWLAWPGSLWVRMTYWCDEYFSIFCFEYTFPHYFFNPALALWTWSWVEGNDLYCGDLPIEVQDLCKSITNLCDID